MKVICQKGRIAAAHGRFNRIRQVATIFTQCNTCFLGPTRVHSPNGIEIRSAVFAGLTIVTDRQTFHATPSVTMPHLHRYRSTTMRPKKYGNANGYQSV